MQFWRGCLYCRLCWEEEGRRMWTQSHTSATFSNRVTIPLKNWRHAGFRWRKNLNEELHQSVWMTGWTNQKKFTTEKGQYLITCVSSKWTGQRTWDSTVRNNPQPGGEGRGWRTWKRPLPSAFLWLHSTSQAKGISLRNSVLRAMASCQGSSDFTPAFSDHLGYNFNAWLGGSRLCSPPLRSACSQEAPKSLTTLSGQLQS